MDPEMRRQAKPYEGDVPESWKLQGMAENRVNRFRYYKAPDGQIYFTIQLLKKKRDPRIDYRTDEQGLFFAKRRFKRRSFEV